MAIDDQQNTAVSIDTSITPQSNPVSIDTGAPGPTYLPPDVVADRAAKTESGIGKILGMEYPDIYSHISQGNESGLRQQAAATLDAHNQDSKQKELLDIAKTPGARLDMDTLMKMSDPNDPRNQPVDPASVIEKGYANYHMATASQAIDDVGNAAIEDAKQVVPGFVNNIKQKGEDLITKNQYVLNKIQDAESTRAQQSWWSWGVDQAKTFATFGMYDEWKLRGWMENVPAISMAGLGEGSNLFEQSIALYRLPFDQFKVKLDQVYEQLKNDNPGMAATWLHGMLGQSLSERVTGDLTTLANVATMPGAGVAAKLLGKAGKAALAVKDVTEAAKLPGATVADIKAAAGDIEGAAVSSAAVDLKNDLQGSADLGHRAMDALKSGMQANRAAVDGAWQSKRGAAFTQEIKNRLDAEMLTTETNILDVAQNVAKVDRIPEVTSYEPAMKKIIAKMKNDGIFNGPANMIGDTVHKLYDQVTNSHWFEFQFLREDGQLFKTEEELRGAARNNGLIPETPRAYIEKLDERIKDLSARITEVEGRPPEALRVQKFQNAVTFFAKKAEEIRSTYGADSTAYAEAIAQHEEVKADLARGTTGVQIPTESAIMHADTTGLNNHFENQAELQKLLQERRDILRRGSEGFPIRDTGAGYYLALLKPLNETDTLVREMIGKTAESKMQENWLGGVANWIRTSKEVLSKFENQMREIATHGPSRLLYEFKKASAAIQKLDRSEWKDWSRAIDFARKDIDPETGLVGHFKQDPSELEEWYQRNAKNGRLPTSDEISAYFAFKNNIEAEASLRDIRSFSLKSRIGVEQHRIYTKDAQGNRTPSDFIEGVVQRDAPGGQATVMIPGERIGQERLTQAHLLPKDIRERIQKGELKVVRIFDPDKYPLKNYGKVGDARVRWIVTSNLESKSISYTQIGRRGGGHFVYNYDNYLKAARMAYDPVADHWNYAGDHTLMPVSSQRVGNDFAKHMNAVSDLLAKGDEQGAKAYHIKNELPMDWDEHHALYKDSHHPMTGEKIPARMRPGDRVYTVPKNQTILDMNKDLENKYGDRFRDRTRQESDARQAVVEFTGERDAYEMFSIGDKGSRANPVFSYEPAKLVDPLPTYTRALNRIINSTFIDDYKISAVEHWIEAAKDQLKTPIEDLRHSPFYHFNNVEWKKGADKFAVMRFEAARYQINQFVGTPSRVDAFLNSTMQKLHDSIYNLSPGTANKLLTGSQLYYSKNPIALARAMTFHAKMGLFSIPQFFMQFTTAANVLAITGPRHIPAVLASTMFHQWSRLNSSPEFIAHLDKMASRMGMRPGEFTEARNLLLRSGFDNIGGEHAFLDTPWTSKIIQNGGAKVLDWGEKPFREGAKNTRIAAFYAAYKEFRAGPLEGRTFTGGKISRRGSQFGQITKEDFASILDRAADLDHNMSRAANSSVHTGIMSPFGQFTAYSLRLMELMTGKRLTWQEKTRLFGASSVLYGVPLGGIGLSGLPIGDMMREKAKADGYIVGENWVSSVFNEGLPSQIMKVIFGDNYNVSHWGAKGFDPASEFFASDKHWWDIMGGAAFSTAVNWWGESSGIRRWAMGAIKGSDLTVDDVMGVMGLKEITSANAAIRLRYALGTGKWLSKNASLLQDNVSVTKALGQTFSGLVDQKIADVTITSTALKDREATNKATEQLFESLVHKGVLARESGNIQQATAYFNQAKAAMTVGDYPLEKRGSLMAKAFAADISLIERLDWDFFMKDVPPSQSKTLSDTFARQQRLKQQGK